MNKVLLLLVSLAAFSYAAMAAGEETNTQQNESPSAIAESPEQPESSNQNDQPTDQQQNSAQNLLKVFGAKPPSSQAATQSAENKEVSEQQAPAPSPSNEPYRSLNDKSIWQKLRETPPQTIQTQPRQ